ncbi:MAG TPA: AAA family ATPase [Kiritimatiellia bacterium]|nr:AAA family ATPase [Kiritimatiellia bacterium]HRZ12349.1 AAA family ATPase [Kiritimatiellia bacterium]HSA17893.1 AAA family ATPase [Kiritimatiellia bacterium]
MSTEPSPEQKPASLYGASLYYDHLYGAAPAGLALLDPRRLLRKWRTLTLTLAFAVVAALGYLWAAEKIYRANSLIELSVRRPRILTQQPAVIEDQAGAQQSTEVFNTRLEKFKGRTMLEAALQRLDAVLPGAFAPASPASSDSPELRHDKRLKRFEKALTLTLVRRSRLIRVEFEHPDPKVATAACNAFADAAEASAYEENRTTSDAAVAWLEAQAELQRKDLLKAEDALLAFRQEHKIDALESERKTVDDALQGFNKSLVDVESREAQESALLAKLEQLTLDPERAGEFPADIPRAEEIRSALEQWRVAVVERNSLLAAFTPKHPEVQAKDNVVALYREEALKALERAKTTARSNNNLLREQAETLRRKKDEQIQLAAKLEMQVVERKTRLAALERSRDAADQSFRGILARIQDARMAADENTATVKIIDRATVPLKPVHPNPLHTLALALLLGFVGGLGLIVALDFLEDRVTGPEDMEGRGIPILAVVPHVRNADRASIATATIRQHFSEVVEAFAGLGTMLDSPQHKERSQVILIASSIPGEGKTVASCNLAAILAKKGRRVLLVDFDLRRPRLAGIFPIPPGRPDLLTVQPEANPRMAGLPYPVADCPNLEVIASRPMSQSNPAVALGALAGALISWARTKYDHVVLDAPPLGLVSDTLALAPLADFTLVMVRPEVSRKRLTWHTIHRMRESGIHSLGLVVNDLDVSKMLYNTYSPYYHYQQHYKAYAPAEENGGG